MFNFCRETEFESSTVCDLSVVAAAQAFKTHRHDLLQAVESAFQLVTHLILKDVLPEATQNRLLFSSLSKSEKNVALLDAIEARIMISPGVFHMLISLFQRDATLQKFAERMMNSYRE